VKEILKQAFICVDKEYFVSIGKWNMLIVGQFYDEERQGCGAINTLAAQSVNGLNTCPTVGQEAPKMFPFYL
jgi:hypothetical protein